MNVSKATQASTTATTKAVGVKTTANGTVAKMNEKSGETKTKVKSSATATKEKAEGINAEGSVEVKSETKVKAQKQ